MNNRYSLTVDTNDDIYIVDRYNAAIRKVDSASGIISTVAGTREPGYSRDGGPGTLAQMREPNVCFLDDNGGLLIADIPDPRIRRLDLDTGIMTTLAGDGEKPTASRLPKRLSWASGRFVRTAKATPTSPRESNGVAHQFGRIRITNGYSYL